MPQPTTLTDVCKAVEDLTKRLFGFEDENWQGGKIGEITRQLEGYHTAQLEFQAQYPSMVKKEIEDARADHQLGVYKGVSKWFVYVLATPIAVGVLVVIILTAIGLTQGLHH
jgi:hypothetical protein